MADGCKKKKASILMSFIGANGGTRINMFSNRLFPSSRAFLFLGIGLVALAVISFPLKIPIQAQPMDVDYYGIGWLLAPIIGTYGLASIVTGLVESCSPKRKIESYLLPLLALVTIGLAYASYLAVVFGSGIIRSVGRGEPFFLIYFGLVLAPSLLIYTLAIKFFRSNQRISFLANKKVQITTFILLAAVPLIYCAVFVLLMYLL